MKFLINYSILLIFIFILNLPGIPTLPIPASPINPHIDLSPEPLNITENQHNSVTITLEKPGKLETGEIAENALKVDKPKAKDKKGKDDKKEKVEDDSKLDLKKRLKKYKSRIILGAIFCLIALITTLINEYSQLRESRMFEDSLKACREVSIEEYEKELDGQIVIANGTIFAQNKLLDQETGVSVDQSLKLARIVEMNQWKELNIDGKVVYQQIWSCEKIDSDKFKNQTYKNPNMEEWVLENKTFYSEHSTLGFYRIQKFHIDSIKKHEGVFIPENYATSIEGNLGVILERKGQNDRFLAIKNNFIYVKSNGNNIDTVGDIRIKYHRIASQDYTIVAGQYENTLVPITSTGSLIKVCDEKTIEEINPKTTIFWINEKKRIKQEMFRLRDQRNLKRDWLLRIFAIGICFLGIYLIIFPFDRNLKELKLVSSLGKFAHLFFTFVLTSLAALLIIGSFWIFRKPWKGFFMFLAMIPFIVILIVIFKKPGIPSKDKKGKGKKK